MGLRVVFLAFCGLAFGQSEAARILKGLSGACRDLYVHGYAVDIQRTRFTQQRFFSGSSTGDRDSIPLPPARLASQGVDDRIVLARSQDRLRFEEVNSAGQDWQWTTDSSITICYRRDLNQYTETLAAGWPQPLGPGPGLPGEEWKYFAKFLAIGDMAGSARIKRDDIAPDRSCSGSSVLIEIALDSGAREELRILNQSHLPCYSAVYQSVSATGLPAERTETVRWRFRERVDANLFVFTPRKRAKRVSGF